MLSKCKTAGKSHIFKYREVMKKARDADLKP